MIKKERILIRIDNVINKGDYVLYWMQRSCRVSNNHALERAVEVANLEGKQLIVFYGLDLRSNLKTRRNYKFLIEGLKEVKEDLEEKKIGFICLKGDLKVEIEKLLKNASALICDKVYLKENKKIQEEILKIALKKEIDLIEEIESDLIVPVATAYHKQALAARTIRPHITKFLDYFNDVVKISKINFSYDLNLRFKTEFDFKNESIDSFLASKDIIQEVKEINTKKGGYKEACKLLNEFTTNKLKHYNLSSDPSLEYTSMLSPYLRFGFISPLEIYTVITNNLYKMNKDDKENALKFIEQLVIRRELAYNFVYYNENYDSLNGFIYDWVVETMNVHKNDKRSYIYNVQDLEKSNTHDPYWNAAQTEMVKTGYMHNYMRMYWCKKIIEWTKTYKEAYDISVYLHNKYALDANDPNTYTGIAWCFGLHDHGWTERKIFGKLRYMNDKGLKRKFKIEDYVEKINKL